MSNFNNITMIAKWIIIQISFTIICCHTVNSENYQIEKINLSHSISTYNCSINNDTINLVVIDSKLYQYFIVNNEVLKKNTYIEPFRYSWSYDPVLLTRPNLTVLYRGDENLNLFQLFDDDPWATDTKIPADFATNFELINRLTERTLIYADNEEMFALNTHNLKSEYTRYYYCNVRGDNIGEIKALNSGRTNIYHFETTSYNDTIYAVWEHSKQKSLLGILLGEWDKSLVFSKYDGIEWSKPITLQDNLDDYPRTSRVLGVYKINNTFFCFWAKKSDSESKSYNRNNIFYQSSNDQINWSEPIKFPGIYKYVRPDEFWIAGNTENNLLHILLNRVDDEYPVYSTFDGKKLEFKYSINEDHTFRYKLTFNNDRPFLFFIKDIDQTNNNSYSTIYYEKMENGDSVLVHLIDTSSKDDDVIDRELYYIDLSIQ